MRRRTSLSADGSTAISREIDSKYDVVKDVSEHLDDITYLASEDIPALIAALEEAKDFTGITVVTGSPANWDEVNKILTVPVEKGDPGNDLTMISIVDNNNGTYTWNFSDGSSFTTSNLTGQTGPQGIQGMQGIQGDSLSVVSIIDNGNGTFVWNFSDGTSYTTPNLRGLTGDTGATGPQGPKGEDLTVEQISYNNDGTFTWQFNDGTNYTTPDLRGPRGYTGAKGDKGDTGISIDHLKGTNTTDLEGDFGTPGETDTYTFYGDADETIVLGHFSVTNGIVEDGTGIMVRGVYDTNENGIVDNSERLEGKTLAEIVADRDAAINAAKLDLGTNYVVANIADRNNLSGLTVGDKVFVTDDGDAKWAQYLVTATIDGEGINSTFEKIMDEDTYLNANTKESIKLAYESNINTNAFTDPEKSKLAGIENGATADQIASEVPYNNTGQAITATDVDGAIDELDDRLVAAEDITEHITVTDSVNLDDVRLAIRLIGNNVLLQGCDISINTDTTKFDISPGVFVIVDNYTDPMDPMYTIYEYAGTTGLTPAFAGTQTASYIAFDTTGNVTQLDHFPLEQNDLRDYLAIGAVVHPSGATIARVSNSVSTTFTGIGHTVAEMGQAIGRITSGNIYSPVGGGLTIRKSAGETFGVGANFKADKKNPNYSMDSELDPVSFIYTYRDGLGDWTTLGGQSDINPTQYDDGTGTLVAVANNKWTVQKVYYASGSGSTVVEYGQAVYASQTEAIESIGIDVTEKSPLVENLIFRGWVLVQGDCTDLANTSKAQFLVANKFGDTSAVSGGVGLTTVSLQQAYNNSSNPEISTDSTRGAITLREGTGIDTGNVLEIQNSLGTVVARIDGEGVIVGTTDASTSLVTPVGDITATNTQGALEGLDTKIDTETTRVDGNALAYAIALG